MTETVEQPLLLPTTPPSYDTLSVQLGRLPPDHLLEGPDPERELIESIRTFGVIDPITIVPVTVKAGEESYPEGFEYIVLSGTRRIKALRLLLAEHAAQHGTEASPPAYLINVPARIPSVDEGDVSDVLAIHANTTRKRNPVMEYQRVRRLMRSHSMKEISTKTGLTTAEIGRLLQLDALPIKLLEGAAHGRVSMGQAYSIVRLPPQARDRLEEKFTSTGKLKTSDIEAERHVRVETASMALDWGAIGETPASTGWTPPEQQEAVSPAYVTDSVRLGRAMLDAIRAMRDLGESHTRVLFAYDGQEFELVAQAVTDQQGGYSPSTDEQRFHPERLMLAADGDPTKIGCPICPAYPGEACKMLTAEQAAQVRYPTTLLDSAEPLPTVAEMRRREAEASVRLDGDTQVYEPQGDPELRRIVESDPTLAAMLAPECTCGVVPDAANGGKLWHSRSCPAYVEEQADAPSKYPERDAEAFYEAALGAYDHPPRPDLPPALANMCEHGGNPDECDLMPCRRKRQQREFARRKRASQRGS